MKLNFGVSLVCTNDTVKTDFLARTYGASQVVLVVKNLPANAGDLRDMGSIPLVEGFLISVSRYSHNSVLNLKPEHRWLSWKRICLQCRRHRRCGFDPWVGKIH